MKQNINIFLKNMAKFVLKNVKMQRLLLNIQIIWRKSIKILKSTTEIKYVKYKHRLMIWLLVWLVTKNLIK